MYLKIQKSSYKIGLVKNEKGHIFWEGAITLLLYRN
jgi:hypothetical protein